MRTLVSDRYFTSTKKSAVRLEAILKHHVVAPEIASAIDYSGKEIGSKFIDLRENRPFETLIIGCPSNDIDAKPVPIYFRMPYARDAV